MAQFDVFASPSARSRSFAPYVVALQSDWTPETLRTTIVAPLIRRATRPDLPDLLVAASVEGEDFWISLPELANVSRTQLRRPVANLGALSAEILRALDKLILGF